MSIDLDGECIHGLGSVDACTICNGREKREQIERDRITHRFTAKFDGHCGKCGQPVSVGDELAATNDGRYLCTDCTPLASHDA